jgi:serine/threonine protein kinase
VIQVINALGALYDQNYFHRDLKFDNLLIDPETYQVKLIDFNSAKLIPPKKICRNKQNFCNTIIQSGYFSAPISQDNDGMVENNLTKEQMLYKDIFPIGSMIFFLITQNETVIDNITIMEPKYENLPFIEVIRDIFDKKIETLYDLVDSSWYKDNIKLLENEVSSIIKEHKEIGTYLQDPYSLLLKLKIEQLLPNKKENNLTNEYEEYGYEDS